MFSSRVINWRKMGKKRWCQVVPVAVPIVFTIVACVYTYVTKTDYHLRLDELSKVELGVGPDRLPPIGELWEQGKMPVQDYGGAKEIIDLASASINLHVNPLGMPTIIRFSTRNLKPSEEAIINAWKAGEYFGWESYRIIAMVDTAYGAGVILGFVTGKHRKRT